MLTMHYGTLHIREVEVRGSGSEGRRRANQQFLLRTKDSRPFSSDRYHHFHLKVDSALKKNEVHNIIKRFTTTSNK